MHTRRLGNNHLEVSAMGLGCWGMSHAYGPADEKESLATMEKALDLGINFFDTADVYGSGHNETLIARVLKNRRQDVVIATKFGFVGDEHGAVRVCGRPEYVAAACEKSLKRLGVDVIDLYYLHRLDPDVPVEETVGAMADLVAEGKDPSHRSVGSFCRHAAPGPRRSSGHRPAIRVQPLAPGCGTNDPARLSGIGGVPGALLPAGPGISHRHRKHRGRSGRGGLSAGHPPFRCWRPWISTSTS